MTFEQFLATMLSPEAIGFGVSIIVYALAEYTTIEEQEAKFKRIIVLGLSLGIGVAAYLLNWIFHLIPQPETWREVVANVFWPGMYAGALAFMGSQVIHIRDLNGKKKAELRKSNGLF